MQKFDEKNVQEVNSKTHINSSSVRSSINKYTQKTDSIHGGIPKGLNEIQEAKEMQDNLAGLQQKIMKMLSVDAEPKNCD